MSPTGKEWALKQHQLVAVAIFAMLMGLFVLTLSGHNPGESLVLPPDRAVDGAPLHLYMSVQPGGLQPWWRASWHVHELTCTAQGVRVNAELLEPSNAKARLLLLSLIYDDVTASHVGGYARILDDPEAMTARLLFPDTSSTSDYRLQDGYLVLDPERHQGKVEATLEDATGKLLFVNARWDCSGRL